VLTVTVQLPEVPPVPLVLLPPLVWPPVPLTYPPPLLVTMDIVPLLVSVLPVPSPTVCLALLPMSVLPVWPDTV